MSKRQRMKVMEGHIPTSSLFRDRFMNIISWWETFVKDIKDAYSAFPIRNDKGEILHTSNILERSPLPDFGSVLDGINGDTEPEDLQKIFKKEFAARFESLYERLADLISDNITLRAVSAQKITRESLQSNADKAIGKIQDCFITIVLQIHDFGRECDSLISTFKEFEQKRDVLRVKYKEALARVNQMTAELKTYFIYANYSFTIEEFVSGEKIDEAKGKLTALEQKITTFSTAVSELQLSLPTAQEYDSKLSQDFSTKARDMIERVHEMAREIKFWEGVFEKAGIDYDPYFTFGVKKEDVERDLATHMLTIIISAPLLNLYYDNEKTSSTYRFAQEAYTLLKSKIASVAYEQNPLLNRYEKIIQRQLVVTIYGITALATRSQGRIWNTYKQVLVRLNLLTSDNEGLFVKVLQISRQAPQALIALNTNHQFDKRREYFILTDLGKRQAEQWRNEFKALGGETTLAELAIATIREMDRERHTKKVPSKERRKKIKKRK